MDTWLKTTRARLAAAGFVVQDKFAFDGKTFPLFARKTRFELTKFGFAENFFTFLEFDRLTSDMLRRFSADAFRCAKRNCVVPLPCGLGESVWSFAVAMAKSVDDAALASVRFDKPAMHFAAAEIPVVYDQAQNRVWYFEKTPLWGAAYYAGFRRKIEQLLG
jgi:hypothetical protein